MNPIDTIAEAVGLAPDADRVEIVRAVGALLGVPIEIVEPAADIEALTVRERIAAAANLRRGRR